MAPPFFAESYVRYNLYSCILLVVGPLNKTKNVDMKLLLCNCKGLLIYSYSSISLLESFFSGGLSAVLGAHGRHLQE